MLKTSRNAARMKRSARPHRRHCAAAVASAPSEISVAVTTACGSCDASASAMAPVPVPRSRMRQSPVALADLRAGKAGSHRPAFRCPGAAPAFPATASASGRRNRDSRKSCGQARRRAAVASASSIAATAPASTARSGARDGVVPVGAGEMLDDQPRLQRRIVDTGCGEPLARRAAATSGERVGHASAFGAGIGKQLATGGRRSAR